jgi:aminopeptidase-like protein
LSSRSLVQPSLKEIVTELWPLHRTLASDGTDEALDIIGRLLPSSVEYNIETYAAGTPAWTWTVPERYVVHEAYLEVVGGERVVDFGESPLHLLSYSVPFDSVLDWDELEQHLYYSVKRPGAVPWEFKYYERDWGFCLSKDLFDRLPRDKKYRAVIRSEFVSDPDLGMRMGVATVHPEGGPATDAGEMMVCAHICHPYQANDGVSGVANAIELARRLESKPLPTGSMSVRMLFCPETIGSVCYFSHHEDLIPTLKGGIFLEMTGNRNTLALQRSLQDDHLLDSVSRQVMQRTVSEFREDAFRKVVVNDELVINGPGVGVPCVSLSRWPYDEYHTSDDNPDIVFEEMLVEVTDVLEEIIRIYGSNYTPRRNFKGPVFLSGYGLWVDWRIDPDLNRALDEIMLRMEGRHTIFDIATEVGLDYSVVRGFVERMRAAGLVEALPIPGPVGEESVR